MKTNAKPMLHGTQLEAGGGLSRCGTGERSCMDNLDLSRTTSMSPQTVRDQDQTAKAMLST